MPNGFYFTDSEFHGPLFNVNSVRGANMTKRKSVLWLAAFAALLIVPSAAQSGYQVIAVENGGTISGTVKWSHTPKLNAGLITKDVEVCDPQGQKRRDYERLLVGANGGVANTVVFLKNVTKGKAMDLPTPPGANQNVPLRAACAARSR
jgi:hypothetical protein